MRTCTKCGITKPFERFRPNKNNKSTGLRPECRDCAAILRRARYRLDDWNLVKNRGWHVAHPRKHKEYMLRSKYGLEIDYFDQMVVEQDGRCAICCRLPEKDLYVDHDHVTKTVRGLLCRTCNLGLGHFEDNPSFLERAREYVMTHAEREGRRK